jgi:hypothetical protein
MVFLNFPRGISEAVAEDTCATGVTWVGNDTIHGFMIGF